MPSWQARLLNLSTKLTMKPLLRYGSVDLLRHYTPIIADWKAGVTPLSPEVGSTAITSYGFDGEWIERSIVSSKKVILSFPGGGFIIRLEAQQRHYLARICEVAHANALIVHYRLAPEHPFPSGLEDCLAAYHYLLEHGHRAEDITIMGESAGGGLVLSTLLALRDEGTPLPGNAVVVSPLADLTFSGESRKTNQNKDPMLPTARNSHMHELYMGGAVPNDRFLSPVFADFTELPPILGIVGSTEILLDDTIRAAKQAEKAGSPFYLEIWKDMPHVFTLVKFLPESEIAVQRIAKFINGDKLEALPSRMEFHSINIGRKKRRRRPPKTAA
jgi:epsilon-lactone hydrolase